MDRIKALYEDERSLYTYPELLSECISREQWHDEVAISGHEHAAHELIHFCHYILHADTPGSHCQELNQDNSVGYDHSCENMGHKQLPVLCWQDHHPSPSPICQFSRSCMHVVKVVKSSRKKMLETAIRYLGEIYIAREGGNEQVVESLQMQCFKEIEHYASYITLELQKIYNSNNSHHMGRFPDN